MGRSRPSLRGQRAAWTSPLQLVVAAVAVVLFSRMATGVFPALGLVRGSGLTPAGRLMYVLAGVATAAVVMARQGITGFRNTVWPLVAVCVLSVLWSADRGRTAFQGIVLISSVLGGCAMHSVWREKTAHALGLLLCTAASASLVADVVGVARPIVEGGLMEHKNLLGSMAAIGAVSFVSSLGSASFARAGAARRWERILQVGLIAGAGLVVVFSESRTSLLVLVVGLGVLLASRLEHLPLRVLVPLYGSALLIGLLAFMLIGGVDGLLASGGKDTTFSGRTDIWGFVIDLWKLRPLQGWGFFAPWGDVRLVPSMETGFEQFDVRSSHNGFLEMLVGVGLLGAATFIIVVARSAWVAYRSRSSWARAVVAMVVVGSVFESTLPGSVSTLPFFVLAGAMSLSVDT